VRGGASPSLDDHHVDPRRAPVPEAPLPPLPPVGQHRWRTAADEVLRRLPLPARAWLPAAAMAIVALAAVGAVVWLRPDRAGPMAIPQAAPAAPEPSVGPPVRGATTPSTAPEEVVVDVSGAVVRPGLVRLRTGARVADAVAAAGGPAPGANLTTLNQARVLADGEQVRVPREGEPPPPPPPVPSSSAGSPALVPVDLNRATTDELDVLPGVGPATAAAIVSWREENGGFRRVEDLLEVPGIGPARLERLRPHVRV
jgi:competence protein ComEA